MSTGENLVLDLVRSRGIPPLMFGMTAEQATDAMSRWGDVEGDEQPDGLMLEVHDEDFSYHMQARFEDGKQLTSIELWRPEGNNGALVTFEGIDLFGLPAREILARLRANGDEVDESDRFYPAAPRVALGFNREQGDERDEQDLAVYFASVLIAPPGYYQSSDT